MKYPSSLLFDLARAIQDAQVAPDDAILAIPTSLSPTITVRGPIARLAGFDAAASQRNSFLNTVRSGLAASQPASIVTICTFGRGLWHVVVQATYAASFTQTLDNTVAAHATVDMVDDQAGVEELIAFFAVNLEAQFLAYEFVALFPVDGWLLRNQVKATGVGQTNVIQTSVMGHRLL